MASSYQVSSARGYAVVLEMDDLCCNGEGALVITDDFDKICEEIGI